jgi:hypothetical protein
MVGALVIWSLRGQGIGGYRQSTSLSGHKQEV